MRIVADDFVEDEMHEGVVGGGEVFVEDLGVLGGGDVGGGTEGGEGEGDGVGESEGEDGVLVWGVAGDEGVEGPGGEAVWVFF